MNTIFSEMKTPKSIAVPTVGALATLASITTSFASETGSGSLPSVAITTDMLTPLVEGVVANVGVILPVGIGLLAISIGIRILPKLISKFTKF